MMVKVGNIDITNRKVLRSAFDGNLQLIRFCQESIPDVRLPVTTNLRLSITSKTVMMIIISTICIKQAELDIAKAKVNPEFRIAAGDKHRYVSFIWYDDVQKARLHFNEAKKEFKKVLVDRI